MQLTVLQALARAIYARKDMIILDDVLSGLDLETENRVFHNLLGRQGLLRKQSTTVLMTSSSGKHFHLNIIKVHSSNWNLVFSDTSSLCRPHNMLAERREDL